MPTDYISNRYMAKLGMPPQQVNWDGSLDFDEVAKFFTLPIAEAANQLGVCTTTLKRICKENNISRWPYRKVLAGKSVEDIKREAARDKRLAEQQQFALNNPVSSSHHVFGSISFGGQTTSIGGDRLATSSMQGNRGLLSPRSAGPGRPIMNMNYYRQKIAIPTFLDEFKQGFPSRSLSLTSNRWWGRAEPSVAKGTMEKKEAPSMDKVAESIGKGAAEKDTSSVFSTEASAYASKLVELKKKRAQCLRKVSNLSISKSHSFQKLNDKQAAMLSFVFGSSLPSDWTVAPP